MSTDTTLAKTSKEATQRKAETRHLLAALGLWRPSLGLSPARSALLVELAEELEGSIDHLVGSDEELYAERAAVAELRRRRDATSKLLGQMLGGMRNSTLGEYVAPDLVRLGFEKYTPREPDAQLRQSDRLVASFRNAEAPRMLGRPLFRQPSFDGRVQADHLEEVGAELRELLVEVDNGNRRIASALLAQREAKKEHDRIYRHTSRIFEDLCRLAGKAELAERVRPAGRRRAAAERLNLPAGVPEPRSTEAEFPEPRAPVAGMPLAIGNGAGHEPLPRRAEPQEETGSRDSFSQLPVVRWTCGIKPQEAP